MKWYVTWGEHRYVVGAGNPYQACMKTMERVFNDNPGIDVINTGFRVSQRGHTERPDDIICSTEEIIKLKVLANNCVIGPEEADDYFTELGEQDEF